MSSTVEPSRIVPADGERRLCSAISEMPGRSSASSNGRCSGRSAAAASRRESGTDSRRRPTSSRVSSTMRSSTLTPAPAPASAPPAARALAAARPSSIAASAARTPSSSVSRLPGDVDRRAGVEHGQVALRAALALEDPPRGGGVDVRRAAGQVLGAGHAAARRPPGTPRRSEALARRPRRRALSPTCSSRPDRRRWTLPAPSRRPASPALPRWCPGTPRRTRRSPGAWRPAGLVSGPRKLKIVRTASSLRTGTTKRVAPWWAGANMKPKPASSMQRATSPGPRSIRTPSASSTSAEPDRPVAERLPCLATAQPAPAAISAAVVETLKVGRPPPVPAVSIRSSRPVLTGVASRRMVVARPTSSSTVSPLVRSAISTAAVCTSEALPSMISASTAAVCSAVRSRREASASIASVRIAKEVLQQPLAVGGEHGLGVELDAERRAARGG